MFPRRNFFGDEVNQGAILMASAMGIFYFRGAELITLVLGGARSGKSRFALELANNLIFPKEGVRGGDAISTTRKAYIATAQPLDDEMKDRIEKHKKERSGEWTTLEEPLNISTLISDINRSYDIILLDCLTLWLSNLLLNNKDVETEIGSFISSLSNMHCSLLIVSNEVGLGIVPDNALSRRFRDLAGYLNQKMAAIADEVYLVTAGIPLRIK
jgi:adenosylcobinamide kinase/adenosylcobinamide-phosphate guanylyltransferase